MQISNWFRNEEGWVSGRDVIFSKELIQLSFFEINKLVKLLNIQGPADVLDLCCGIGRHSIQLARHGFTVTGVDITRPYLETAAENARKQNLDINFLQGDMREYRRADAYDLITNLYTSFGYFEDAGDDRKVLENCFHSLRPGGRLVIEMLGKEVVAKNFWERQWFEHEGNTILEKRRILQDWSMLEYTRTIMRNGEKKEMIVYHRLYSAAELKELLQQQGFRNIAVYGDYSGSPYNNHARTMVVIAQK